MYTLSDEQIALIRMSWILGCSRRLTARRFKHCRKTVTRYYAMWDREQLLSIVPRRANNAKGR